MDKFADLLSNLAVVVGVQVERLWPQVVYVYWLRNLMDLIATPLLIAALFMGCKRLVRMVNDTEDGGYHDDRAFFIGMAALVVGVAGAVGTIVYALHMPTMVSALLAPEASFVLDRLPK